MTNMGNLWCVKGISQKTKDTIKKEAQDNGLTIGEFLEATFDGPLKKKASSHWRVNGVKRSTAQLLVRNARTRNLTVGQYLDKLARRDEDEAEAQAKLNKVKGVING